MLVDVDMRRHNGVGDEQVCISHQFNAFRRNVQIGVACENDSLSIMPDPHPCRQVNGRMRHLEQRELHFADLKWLVQGLIVTHEVHEAVLVHDVVQAYFRAIKGHLRLHAPEVPQPGAVIPMMVRQDDRIELVNVAFQQLGTKVRASVDKHVNGAVAEQVAWPVSPAMGIGFSVYTCGTGTSDLRRTDGIASPEQHDTHGAQYDAEVINVLPAVKRHIIRFGQRCIEEIDGYSIF